jgi:catechol 2,3-dioxygenase-like lactoylglutathione lyase family enzyme
MTGRAGASRAVLVKATPQLFVADIAASCAFFTSKLGFAVEFVYGEPPFYGQVARDSASLALRHVDRPVRDAIARAMKADIDMLAASLSVNDVTALFREYQHAGAPFPQTLRTEPWGAQTFIVTDPDGNLLLFAGA